MLASEVLHSRVVAERLIDSRVNVQVEFLTRESHARRRTYVLETRQRLR